MVDSWKVIDGVRYVDISNLPDANYIGVPANTENEPPTLGGIIGNAIKTTLFDSGLEVFTYFANKGVNTSPQNFQAELKFGTNNGVAVIGKMLLSVSKNSEDIG